MKKLTFSLVFLIILYFLINWSFKIFSKGHEINYKIINDNEFNIKEVFKTKYNNYYLEININDTNFTYQVFKNFNKKNKIIKDIYYYEDENYKCLLPRFRDNEFYFDIMCYDGSIYKYYNSIINPNNNLKKFISSIKDYDINNWKNSSKILKQINTVTVYDNLIKNHFLGISNYKGVYLINQKEIIKNISIFDKDIYQRPISGYINKYYLTADYTGINSFNNLKIVNLKNGETFKISSSYKISFNSYILGSVNDSIYLYDKENRIQYEINIRNNNISIIGSKDKFVKFYSNGNWEDLDIDKFEDNMTFGDKYKNDYQNYDYIKIIKNGSDVGYYYLFKFVNGKYEVYRTDIQNHSNITYIFTTTDYNKIVFLDDYIYYIDNNKISYYSDKTGNRLVIQNTELEFNKTIKFSVYQEK